MDISNLYAVEEYKNKIINLLLKSNDFIELVNPTPSKCEDLDIIDVMIGGEWIIKGVKWKEQGHIFDYNFVDDTVTDNKTFIFVDASIEKIRDNIFTDFDLRIFIFTSKSLVRLNSTSVPTAKRAKDMGYFSTSSSGNRIGILCDCVDRIINNSEKINGIGSIKPSPRNHMTSYTPNKNYYGKVLQYEITNYNSGGDSCGD